MLFNSYEFTLIFLPVALAGFYLFTHRRLQKIRLGWLLACSVWFYAYWHPANLNVLLLSVALNFLFASLIARDRGRIWWLRSAILFNLSLLAYFKYATFFAENFETITDINLTVSNVVLPLGISFFTFQQIAYQVDLYRDSAKFHSVLNYGLFVSFFPQLIAGPIVHHREMMPQFERFSSVDKALLVSGMTLFAIGLFKKMIIADPLEQHVAPVFDAGAGSGIQSVGATLAYGLQLYFDFSGYSDMALGLAALFGIRLPVNFNSPYKATDIQDFWRRWHMTLSRFLRDYLYIPLGGNRHGDGRTAMAVLATFLLGGLWHGAAWTFVLWGAIHGAANIAMRSSARLKLRLPARLGKFITFTVVMLAWVPFRAASIEDTVRIYRSMTEWQSWTLHLGEIHILIVLVIALNLPNSNEIANRIPLESRKAPAIAILTAIALAISLSSMGQISPFLYFNF